MDYKVNPPLLPYGLLHLCNNVLVFFSTLYSQLKRLVEDGIDMVGVAMLLKTKLRKLLRLRCPLSMMRKLLENRASK